MNTVVVVQSKHVEQSTLVDAGSKNKLQIKCNDYSDQVNGSSKQSQAFKKGLLTTTSH